MLHEILLSLSGHPSPLLNNDYSSPSSILSPQEKALLASISNLGNLHCNLLAQTSTIAATHDSSICQAVVTAIRSKHLFGFQRKILEVEDSLLRNDNVGKNTARDYNIMPLTAIVCEFSGWTRLMEWLIRVTEFITCGEGKTPASVRKCSGAMIINYLRGTIQTGYVDIEEAALSLVTAAESAWLKQISAWVLYGRLPSFGREDFFVQTVMENNIQEFEIKKELLPAFVSDSTAGSIIFIGRSLNQIWTKRSLGAKSPGLYLLQTHLQCLSSLKFPITSANFSRAISLIRLSLSQKTLKSLLPLSRVNRILSLLRKLFLLGRGEFAIALITEADERMRLRWRQSQSLSFESRDGNVNILPKEGEVSAILARTWATLSALQGQNENLEEDELLELARDLVQLSISKPSATITHHIKSNSVEIYSKISSTPFKNLLLSVPTSLTMRIPTPLDLFLTPADIQVYSCINAYLLSIRRAHLRLTDLWKIQAMRRHRPAPRGRIYQNSITGTHLKQMRRKKINERFSAMRSVWATSSAALFFLSETEAYFQGEVVQSTWIGFKDWINGNTGSQSSIRHCLSTNMFDVTESNYLQTGENLNTLSNGSQSHDPQSLADAHQRYLSTLASGILLTISAFTHPLYHLLQQIDHLVALVHRIHSIWQSLDLEADEGVVDAFSDFHKEEKDVRTQLRIVAAKVKTAIENLVLNGLRDIDQDQQIWDNSFTELASSQEGQEGQEYIPAKVGRIDRLP